MPTGNIRGAVESGPAPSRFTRWGQVPRGRGGGEGQINVLSPGGAVVGTVTHGMEDIEGALEIGLELEVVVDYSFFLATESLL